MEKEDEFTSQLPQWISKVSTKGNGDDISLIVVEILDALHGKGYVETNQNVPS